MIAKPVDVQVFVDARLAHRAPDLHHPAEHAQVIVNPVEGAADDLFRVVAKLVIDGDVGIAGDLGPLSADLLKMPEVLGVHFGVGKMIERTQQHAAPGVKRDAAGRCSDGC
mgnify:CR=1 FL=1